MPKNESLAVEFKEFCLKLPIEQVMKQEKIKSIFTNFKFNKVLNEHVEKNIKYYFDYYVPKYISSFSNADIKKGCLYIGVNDSGEITGIPTVGVLKKKVLKNFLENSKKHVHIDSSNCTVDDYFKKIKIKVQKLQIDPNIVDDFDTNEFVEKIELHQQKYHHYKKSFEKKKNDWSKELFHYSKKIIDFCNDSQIREEMITWMIEHSVDNNIIQYIKHTPYIKVTSNDIFTFKEDVTHHLHWILKFRDLRIRDILHKKPYWEFQEFKCQYYSLPVNKLTPLRKKWMENNDMKFYLIKIIFPGGKLFENTTFFYKQDAKLLYRKRSILKNDVVGCESE